MGKLFNIDEEAKKAGYIVDKSRSTVYMPKVLHINELRLHKKFEKDGSQRLKEFLFLKTKFG